MPDLCKLEDVKAWLNQPAAANANADALLTRLIKAVSRDFLSAIDRLDLVPEVEFTEVAQVAPRHDDPARASVRTKHWPINSVTSVTRDDGTVIAVSADGIADGYFFEANPDPESRTTLQLINSHPACHATVLSIKYKAGYTTVPEDIEQAVIEWVAFKFKTKDSLGQSARTTTQGERIDFQQIAMPDSTRAVIDRYERRSYGF